MKTLLLSTTLLLAGALIGGGALAQTVTEKDKKADELKKKQDVTIVVDGKKLSEEQLRKELEKVREIQGIELEKLGQYRLQQEDIRRMNEEAMKVYEKSLDDLKNKDYLVVPSTPRWSFDAYGSPEDGLGMWTHRENSTLSISKNLESETTYSTDFSYQIKSGSMAVSFMVQGAVKSGQMMITLKKPDGKAFQEINISQLADVNWNQTFRWEEDDEEEFLGKWIITVKADKAVGNYSIRVNSR